MKLSAGKVISIKKKKFVQTSSNGGCDLWLFKAAFSPKALFFHYRYYTSWAHLNSSKTDSVLFITFILIFIRIYDFELMTSFSSSAQGLKDCWCKICLNTTDFHLPFICWPYTVYFFIQYVCMQPMYVWIAVMWFL